MIGIPQLIMIILFVIGITVSSIKHGEEKGTNLRFYNIWITLFKVVFLSLPSYWLGSAPPPRSTTRSRS